MRAAVSIATLSLVGLVFACGGKDPSTPQAKPADAGAPDAAPPKLTVRPPPSGLPPLAAMPEPGVAGSKKAKVKADPALGTCSEPFAARSKDPAAQLKKLADACAAAKMKPASAIFRGTQGDKDAHQENKLHVEANHCYRIYVATDEAVKQAVVILRDSNGDIVVESPAPAAPESGAACFTSADDVTLLVGIGAGKGAWAAQVFSD